MEVSFVFLFFNFCCADVSPVIDFLPYFMCDQNTKFYIVTLY
jgi:hypothetical protein